MRAHTLLPLRPRRRPKLPSFAFNLVSLEGGRRRGERLVLFPRQHHAVLLERRNENNRRVRRNSRPRFADQPVHFFQFDGLQLRQHFPPELSQNFAAFLRQPSFRKLRFLSNQVNDQDDNDGYGNENRRKE